MLGLMALLGTMLVLFSLSTYLPWIVLTFFIIALVGMIQTGFNAMNHTVLLEKAPEEMRGRIMGLLSLDRAMISFGASMAGFTAAAVGPQTAQIAFGAGCVGLALLLGIALPSVRRVE